jgi:glycosyltransferase involved in cell wall biosynthesis
VSLDADELLAEDDAAALRAFVCDGADPDDAYLFRVFRMIGDLEHYDTARLCVGRLFAPRPGHVFPTEGLHWGPIPTAIPRERWRETTIRMQHRAAMTEAPGRIHSWYPRGPQLPVLAHAPVVDPTPRGRDEPALSAIIIAQNDEARIEQAVRSVVSQEVDEPIEVIVVASGTDRTASVVRLAFPAVTVIELDEPALPGAARNAGLRIARGRYVSFPGSHIDLAPGSLAARLDAHRRGWAMVTGTMLNGTRTWAGWASYFLDNPSVLPDRPSFAYTAPPLRCSYRRDVLLAIGGFPEDVRAGEDTDVNTELFQRGYGAYRERAAASYHHSPCRRPGRLLRHHFERGRALGRIKAAATREAGNRPAFMIGYLVVTSVPIRLHRTHRQVNEWGGALRAVYFLSLPLIVAGAIGSWAGTCYELLRQLRRPPVARPSMPVDGSASS